jgi:hypothetical protein
MEWFVPLALIVCGVLCIAIEHMLRRYISTHFESRSFQKKSYYSAQQLADRFTKRMPLSWAMIAFGVFWTITNII